MSTNDLNADVLTAPYKLEYTYKRALGPVLGAFLTGLREGRIQGIKAPDGRVIVPPQEYDPATGESLDELVDVGDAGVVTTWCWVREPGPRHPFDRPFAFALIQLDGADTSMLHAIDAPGPEAMSTGMRVRARWADERIGRIQDIACFEPEPS